MADLDRPQWEAFARALATGMTKTAAYTAAGYKKSCGAASRLSQKPPVKARVKELVILRDTLRTARLEETIVALLVVAHRPEPKTGAELKEARLAQMEAHRMCGLLTSARDSRPRALPRPMTEAEWTAKYGRAAPMPAG